MLLTVIVTGINLFNSRTVLRWILSD